MKGRRRESEGEESLRPEAEWGKVGVQKGGQKVGGGQEGQRWASEP